MDRGFSSMARGLARSAAKLPDKPALIEIDRLTLSYRELAEGAARLANRLAARGVRKGDHVAIMSENSVEHIVSLYAVAALGAVSVALDPKWTPVEVARAVTTFDCRLLVLDDALQNLVSDLPPGALTHGVFTYHKHPTRCELIESVRDESAQAPQTPTSDHDICTIILTSGTTGFPKGVIRTHRNIEMGCINGALGKGQTEDGRELAVVPIFYGSGRGSVVGQIYLGATVYILSQFDPERTAHVLEKERITAVAMAPTMCRRMLQLPGLERFDFSALRSLRKAGSPFTSAMATEMIQRITPNIYQSYGSSETGSVTLLRPEEALRKLGSSGRREWGVEAEIVDTNGRTLTPGEEGEMRVRGPSISSGYYKNPDEEARVFRQGWFHTGDIGRFDEDGYLYVVGRIKDTIKTGSINVSPREVETVIQTLYGIDDVAVVGVPDPEWGEAVKAFVVLRAGASEGADTIIAHCRAQLAGYKVPKSVAFVPAIERNGLGKVTAEFKARARS
jgi:acyl-CoA synthetase (AMP-forming)/AMP-acid ligase II